MEFDLLAKIVLVLFLVYLGYQYLWLPWSKDPNNKAPVEILQEQILSLKKSLTIAIADINEMKEKKPSRIDIVEATDELKNLSQEFLKCRQEVESFTRLISKEVEDFKYEVRAALLRVERDAVDALKDVKSTHYHYAAEPKTTKRKSKTKRG